MGLSSDYQDSYNSYLANTNKNTGKTPSIPEGVDVAALSNKVAQQGASTPHIGAAIGGTLEKGNLNSQEVAFLQQPQNAKIIVESIAQSTNPAALQYLQKAMALDKAANKALQMSGLIAHADTLAKIARGAEQGSAINSSIQNSPEANRIIQAVSKSKGAPNNRNQNDFQKNEDGSLKNIQGDVPPQELHDEKTNPTTGKERYLDSNSGKYVDKDPATYGKVPQQEQFNEPVDPNTGKSRYIDPATGNFVNQDPKDWDFLQNQQRFNEPVDPETGLRRWQDPTTGKYVDFDPAGSNEPQPPKNLRPDQEQFDEQFDPKTGKARYIDPDTGKFVDKDPYSDPLDDFDPEEEWKKISDQVDQEYADKEKDGPGEEGQGKGDSNIQDIDSDKLAERLQDSKDKAAEDEFLRRNLPEDLRAENGLSSNEEKEPNFPDKTRYTEIDGRKTALPRLDGKDDPESGFVQPHQLRESDRQYLENKADRQALKSEQLRDKNAQLGNTEATEKYGQRALDRTKLENRVKNKDFGEASKPTAGGIADKAKRAVQAARAPKEHAKNLGKKLAKEAFKEGAKWAGGLALQVLPWILLFLAAFVFVMSLIAGVFVVVYCYTEELDQQRTHAIFESVLTNDPSLVDNFNIGRGVLAGQRIKSTSDIGKFLEENVCAQVNPNFCGQTGTPSRFGGGDYGQGNGDVTAAQCDAFKRYLPLFEAAGREYSIDPVLLGAIASRETRIGTIAGVDGTTGCDIVGDNGFGIGLMQIDTRYHQFANSNGAFDCEANIRKGAEILRDFMDQYRDKPLRQQINAYNAGRPCSDGTDGCTTGDDYGSDVLARAADLQTCAGNSSGNQDNVFYNARSMLDYARSREGLRFLLNGGSINVQAAGPGSFEYAQGEDQAVSSLISTGRIVDTVVAVSGGSRPPFATQVERNQMHPIALQSISSVLQNNPQLVITVSSAYRAGERPTTGGHGSGEKIDVSDISLDGGATTYSHTQAYNGNQSAVDAWYQFAQMLKNTGALRHIITGDNIYQTLVADSNLSDGLIIVRDDPRSPRYGGIHHHHYDIRFDPGAEVNYQYALAANCACGNGGAAAGTGVISSRDSSSLAEITENTGVDTISVLDIESGQLSHHNGDTGYYMASVVKVLIAHAISDEVARGNLELDAVSDDLREMLRRSANDSTNNMITALGGTAQAQSKINALGYSLVMPASWGAGSTQLKANDASKAMANIFANSGAGYDVSKQALKDAITGQTESGVALYNHNRVGNKTGNTSNTIANTSYMDINGKKYVVSVRSTSSNGVNDSQKIDVPTQRVIDLISSGGSLASTKRHGSDRLRTIGKILLTPFGLQVHAAYGERPTSYANLSQDHKQLLSEAAQERGFVGYRDAGGVDGQTQTALNAMTSAASQAGVTLTVGSAYRSYDDQVGTYFRPPGPDVTNPIEFFWSEILTDEEEENVKQAYIDRGVASAPPGFSRHSTGLAFDFVTGGGLIQASSSQYTWLKNNADDYGFEISYPEDNSGAADFEPWEWVFVGNDVYKIANSLESFETGVGSDDQGIAGDSTCVCSVDQVFVDELNQIEYSWEWLKNRRDLAFNVLTGELDAEAALRAVEVETNSFNPRNTGSGEPEDYDVKVTGDRLNGDRFYRVISNNSRNSNSISINHQNFYDSAAAKWQYVDFKDQDRGQVNPKITEAVGRLQELAREHELLLIDEDEYTDLLQREINVSGGFGLFRPKINVDLDDDDVQNVNLPVVGPFVPQIVNGYLSPVEQGKIFLQSGDSDFNNVERLYDDEMDTIPILYDEAERVTGGNPIEVVRYMSERGYTTRVESNSARGRFSVRIGSVWVSEKVIENIKQKSFEDYVNRAFYFAPPHYDDRQTGDFVDIYRPTNVLLLEGGSETYRKEFDLGVIDREIEIPNYRHHVFFNPDKVDEKLIPEQVREGEDKNIVSIGDWLAYAAPSAGIKLSQTFFSKELLGTVAERTTELNTDYDVDFVDESVAVDVDGEPIEREDGTFIDPNFDDTYAEEQNDKASDIEIVANLALDLGAGANSEENQKLYLFAHYVNDELGYDLNERIDANGDGEINEAESFIDGNDNGQWDEGEEFTDENNNGTYDSGDPYKYSVQNLINIKNANFQRRKINTSAPAGPGQSGSTRQNAIDSLNDLEKEIFFDLDGDFRIVGVPSTREVDPITGEETFREYQPVDTTGVDLAIIEDRMFNIPEADEDDFEDDKSSRLNRDGSVSAPAGSNAREQATFAFYDSVSRGGSRGQAYLSEYAAATEFSGDDQRRFELSGEYNYFTFDEEYKPPELDEDDNPVETPATSATVRAQGAVQCEEVGGEFDGTLQNPLSNGAITVRYGQRTVTVDGVTRTDLHDGIDISAGGGGQVKAAATGKAISVVADNASDGCGNYVIIEHEGGLQTGYCHLESISVDQGEAVVAGQTIGIEGDSGVAATPHLHFFVNKNGQKVDPCENGLTCN